MDFSKLKPSDWLVGGGAIVFLIAMFLPWYKVDIAFIDVSASGWDYFLLGIVPFLLDAAIAVFVLLPLFSPSVNLPATFGPVDRAKGLLIAAAVAAALVLLRLLFKDDGGAGGEADDIIDRGIGLFLAFLASLAVLAGVFMKQKETGAGAAPSGPATPF